MEEKGQRSHERMLTMRDEKEFHELIEKRYKEQGFVLWEDTPAVRIAERDADFSRTSFEDEEPYSQEGFKGLEKIFAF